MSTQRTWFGLAGALTVVALLAFASPARAGHGGGGMHGGGGFHGGGMHANGFHGGGFHGGGFNHHPYQPSDNHFAHHNHPNNGQFAHYNHHHEDWHNGYWGPGFWGGAAIGYGLGNAYAPWGWGDGGNTYVDNSEYVTPADYDGSYDDSDASSDDSSSAPQTAGTSGMPTDEWPELGISTYSGQYGSAQGQVVLRILPGSAAAKAGFVPGDVILSVNGQPTPSADALEQVLESAQGNFSAQVWDARTGRTSTLTGNLDANAEAPTQAAPARAASLQ
jgi:membrane-associated protease RseP (regulator of RpoE activity)